MTKLIDSMINIDNHMRAIQHLIGLGFLALALCVTCFMLGYVFMRYLVEHIKRRKK